MIGVIASIHQTDVVEEFFELFKTPWEFYASGKSYDVVIAATTDVPEVQAKLLLIYSSKKTTADDRYKLNPQLKSEALPSGCGPVIIYGEVLAPDEIAESKSGCKFGMWAASANRDVIRAGYDLFCEVRMLLSKGQPVDTAASPTLEIHIQMLREWIVNFARIPLVEITPAPYRSEFIVCLTHDIDFIGIRKHAFDHSMWGFVYRATIGSMRKTLRGRLPLRRMLDCWLAVASLPLVLAGWLKDFWEPFEWYMEVEKGLPATYFLIPFKHRAGELVTTKNGSRRASGYDVTDLVNWTGKLQEHGYELGVHGLDSWHSVEKGKEELDRVAAVANSAAIGIRMHWLLQRESTPSVLEQTGYRYDSTCGYNDTVGFRAGTSQVFRPLGVRKLLELPLHIQDGALFYPDKLNLTEPEAEKRCKGIADDIARFGGVLTLLWHDRSHGPERFWGEFYAKMIAALRERNVWFASGRKAVQWFACRRRVQLDRATGSEGQSVLRLEYDGDPVNPPLNVRVYQPDKKTLRWEDYAWTGENRTLEFNLDKGGKSYQQGQRTRPMDLTANPAIARTVQ